MVIHENTRHTRRTRTSTIPSHRAARRGPPAGRGRQDPGRLAGSGLPVEEALSASRARWPEGHAAPRAQAQADDAATPETGAVVAERPSRLWVRDESLDAETDYRADREAFCRPLRSFGRLARAQEHGLELPRTRTPSRRVRRGCRCRLASTAVAADRRKHIGVAIAPVPSMRAALCSSKPKCNNPRCTANAQHLVFWQAFLVAAEGRAAFALPTCQSQVASHFIYPVNRRIS